MRLIDPRWLFCLLLACAEADPGSEVGNHVQRRIRTDVPTTVDDPIGLAIEIENGEGRPLRVRAGQTFFIDQIDLRTFVRAESDRGVDTLIPRSDVRPALWNGVERVEAEPAGLPNPDGTFTRRIFFRNARWMRAPSVFRITQMDAAGQPTAAPVHVHAGQDERRVPADDFFIRRLRAIQWINDCVRPDDCTGATEFLEEMLVELRHATGTLRTFRMQPDTVALHVRWSLGPSRPYSIPIEQIAAPAYDYGFRIDLEPETPPGPGGFHPPGTDVTFRVTLRDGSGNPLHPDGALPTYEEVIFGPNPAGIQYYRAFFDPTITYYRRKHRERMLMVAINGPTQAIQPIRSILELADFLEPNDVQVVGTPAVDGVYAAAQLIPPGNDLFGGAFDPDHAGWRAPVSDRVTFPIPADAEPGAYLITIKGRRVYLGQDIPHTTTVEIQVGTEERREPTLTTGPCTSCHSGGGALGVILHANDDRATCAGCHAPLAFELDVPVVVRVHFIHSRSRRYDADLARCARCHLTPESIQRTSKSACLSCHRTYPDTHVAAFGPIESIFVGGGRESFQQCTDRCHLTHPRSGL